jgi:hypothetical protein
MLTKDQRSLKQSIFYPTFRRLKRGQGRSLVRTIRFEMFVTTFRT